jgi:hypothetical protein
VRRVGLAGLGVAFEALLVSAPVTSVPEAVSEVVGGGSLAAKPAASEDGAGPAS